MGGDGCPFRSAHAVVDAVGVYNGVKAIAFGGASLSQFDIVASATGLFPSGQITRFSTRNFYNVLGADFSDTRYSNFSPVASAAGTVTALNFATTALRTDVAITGSAITSLQQSSIHLHELWHAIDLYGYSSGGGQIGVGSVATDIANAQAALSTAYYASTNTAEFIAEFGRIWTLNKIGAANIGGFGGGFSTTDSYATQLTILVPDAAQRGRIADAFAQALGFANDAAATWTPDALSVLLTGFATTTATGNECRRLSRPIVSWDELRANGTIARCYHFRADLMTGDPATQPAAGAVTSWTNLGWWAGDPTRGAFTISSSTLNASRGGVTFNSNITLSGTGASRGAMTFRMELTTTSSGGDRILLDAGTSYRITQLASGAFRITGPGARTTDTATVASGQRIRLTATWRADSTYQLVIDNYTASTSLNVVNSTTSTATVPSTSPVISSGSQAVYGFTLITDASVAAAAMEQTF